MSLLRRSAPPAPKMALISDLFPYLFPLADFPCQFPCRFPLTDSPCRFPCRFPLADSPVGFPLPIPLSVSLADPPAYPPV